MVRFSVVLSLLALVGCCQLIECQHPDNLIRVSLSKTTLAQAGEWGQPVTSYFANTYLGTPPKNFKLLVDINARETWVPHYLKLGILFQRLNYRSGYMKKGSSSSVKEEQEYTIDYDKQVELVGKAYQDYFEFKTVLEGPPARFKQRFLAISSASNDKFSKFNVDGVMALNSYPLSEAGSDLPLVSIHRANWIRDMKFSLLLDGQSSAVDDPESFGGELAFGKVDNPNKYLGALKYHQVTGQHNWELNLQSVMLGGESISCFESSCGAVLSTNHNEIYGPEKDVAKIIKMLGLIKDEKEFWRQLYEIDCLKVASSPSLTFIIDGAYYVLHPLSYIRKKVDGLLFKSSTCYVAIGPNDSKNKWQLGTNFLSNYYTIFDANKRQVAFGVKR